MSTTSYRLEEYRKNCYTIVFNTRIKVKCEGRLLSVGHINYMVREIPRVLCQVGCCRYPVENVEWDNSAGSWVAVGQFTDHFNPETGERYLDNPQIKADDIEIQIPGRVGRYMPLYDFIMIVDAGVRCFASPFENEGGDQ